MGGVFRYVRQSGGQVRKIAKINVWYIFVSKEELINKISHEFKRV